MSLARRSSDDLMMLAYVVGVQRAMPSVSDTRAIERFIKDFGHHCAECDVEALRKRLSRLRNEWHESRKTQP